MYGSNSSNATSNEIPYNVFNSTAYAELNSTAYAELVADKVVLAIRDNTTEAWLGNGSNR